MKRLIIPLILAAGTCYADTNSMTLPDGSKVILLQAYSGSYMVTKEGEHKPFFIEKNQIKIEGGFSKEEGHYSYATNLVLWKNPYSGPTTSALGGGLTEAENIQLNQAQCVAHPQFKPGMSEQEFNKLIIQADPSTETIIKKRDAYKPWEHTNNAISVLTPEEGAQFVALVKRVNGEPGWSVSGSSVDKIFENFESQMIKDDPSVKPLLEKVKRFKQ